jgi:hypothetical protein
LHATSFAFGSGEDEIWIARVHKDGKPMLRISATIVLAFTCAAPFVLLFSDLVAHGVRALIQ